ncbi:LLM class flavin-dependent oxidoreductase [Agrococcus sp. HG114]|uniref:LLM class flavin-dependent oxidoreductase n=1 Tax=Agrococcus sp. HG114 TaxID=2969757 RepID=UPI00215A192D|nr:LLM class flavin-dependent oxidoreductase [Agrococcus sp. HG114]MCR8670246.1 LLM class flavin-dependent oxidoreductase [Agrococcus sp. HG114]
MDYGHPIEFGVFITPGNAPAQRPVQLAQAAERLGFDLATFQDHPYQPAFLDTWTLLSYLGAATERIRLAPNVANVPLRQPAVLARSAASLDLLTGGRFELGLGAGGFWDAIAAMGGDRLTPGQGVDALAEAIAIIRGIWDTSERGGVHVDGEHHRVAGAKRGPRPAHRLPIHIGAYKPRMLRLTGRLGDGWLPSLGYLQPGDLERGNATIDRAAEQAGREPREIRRLLNIGGDFADDGRLEQLVELALEHGTSTFILAADDAGLMQRFIEEVAPEVRERVAAERTLRGTEPAGSISAAGLRLRAAGIDYGAIPASLRATAVEPGSWEYPDVRSTYLRGGAPGLVLRPTNPGEVADALAYARSQGAAESVPLSIRSAGHGISGRSTNDGGIVIELGALDRIDVVDASRRLVRIGAGATWGRVATVLDEHGWAISSGDYGGVGVGGLATAGGVGFLGREHGLTIDHVEAVEVVLADGRLVRASRDEHEELFWGMRGAGANLGVAVAFEIAAQPVGEIGFAQLAFDASNTAGFFERFGAVTEASDRVVTPFLLLGGDRPGQPRVAQAMIAVDASDPDTIVGHLQPFATVAPLVGQHVVRTRYASVIDNAPGGAHQGQGEPTTRSALIGTITPEVARALARFVDAGVHYFFQVRAMGEAIADVPAGATAFAHREARFSVIAFGADRARLDAAWDTLIAPHASGLYLSFETDQRPGRLEEAFPPATLARLRALKAEVDPENLFRDNFNVVAAAQAPAARV